jgi:hypothetical protein
MSKFDKLNFSYSIENFDIDKNYITVSLYSDDFLKPKQYYEYYNISITNFNLNEDIEKQLIRQCSVIVDQILRNENVDLLKNKLKIFIEKNQDIEKKAETPVKKIKENNTINSNFIKIEDIKDNYSSFEVIN